MLAQASQVEAQLYAIRSQKTFMLSEANRIEFFSVPDEDWAKFAETCSQATEIKSKDIVILRLYMAMLDHLPLIDNKNDTMFLKRLANFLKGS